MKHSRAAEWIEGWDALSTYTGLPKRTLQRMEGTETFVGRRLGKTFGRVLFVRVEVDAWLDDVFERRE